MKTSKELMKPCKAWTWRKSLLKSRRTLWWSAAKSGYCPRADSKPRNHLADEPTASLDPKTSHQVMEDLRMLNEKYNMTVVANLHSIELAKEFGHRVIGVRAGEIVYDGKMEDTPQSVFDSIYNGGTGKEED